MASNYMDVLARLRLYCHTFEDLEAYVQNHGIDPNCEEVVLRRNELFSNELITDADTYRLLMVCCNSPNELTALIHQQGLDHTDPVVQRRSRELQVRAHNDLHEHFL